MSTFASGKKKFWTDLKKRMAEQICGRISIKNFQIGPKTGRFLQGELTFKWTGYLVTFRLFLTTVAWDYRE
jgi:hypothetical protein